MRGGSGDGAGGPFENISLIVKKGNEENGAPRDEWGFGSGTLGPRVRQGRQSEAKGGVGVGGNRRHLRRRQELGVPDPGPEPEKRGTVGVRDTPSLPRGARGSVQALPTHLSKRTPLVHRGSSPGKNEKHKIKL